MSFLYLPTSNIIRKADRSYLILAFKLPPSVCMQNDILLTERPLFRFPQWRQNPHLKARNGVPCTEFAATVSPEGQRLLLPPMTWTYNIQLAPNERRRVISQENTVTYSFLAGLVGGPDRGRYCASAAGLRPQAGWAFRQHALL